MAPNFVIRNVPNSKSVLRHTRRTYAVSRLDAVVATNRQKSPVHTNVRAPRYAYSMCERTAQHSEYLECCPSNHSLKRTTDEQSSLASQDFQRESARVSNARRKIKNSPTGLRNRSIIVLSNSFQFPANPWHTSQRKTLDAIRFG